MSALFRLDFFINLETAVETLHGVAPSSTCSSDEDIPNCVAPKHQYCRLSPCSFDSPPPTFVDLIEQLLNANGFLLSGNFFHLSVLHSSHGRIQCVHCPSGTQAPPPISSGLFNQFGISCRDIARWRPPTVIPQIITKIQYF